MELRVIGAALVTLSSSLALVLPASAGVPRDDPAPPPTGQVTIDLVATNGSGCPPGTATVTVSPDNTTFTVTYDQYLARAGLGAAPTDFRKNCQLTVNVRVPEGYAYAIPRVEHHGVASLAAGATGMQRTAYSFQSPVPFTTHTFTGPIEDDWHTIDETDIVTPVVPPCEPQRTLTISTELRVSTGTSDPAAATSFLAMDPSAATTYHLRWRHCS